MLVEVARYEVLGATEKKAFESIIGPLNRHDKLNCREKNLSLAPSASSHIHLREGASCLYYFKHSISCFVLYSDHGDHSKSEAFVAGKHWAPINEKDGGREHDGSSVVEACRNAWYCPRGCCNYWILYYSGND